MIEKNEIFSDIIVKCTQPSVAILRETLQSREKLSIAESNFITYMASFSHYEFSKTLFEEFGLKSIADGTIIFDSIHQKYHFKVVINNLMGLNCFSNFEGYDENDNELYSDKYKYFRNYIFWRNKDGSYINNSYGERKSLDKHQYQKYCEEHIIGLLEDVCSCEVIHEGINCVASIANPPKNIVNNLSAIFNRANSCILMNTGDDMPFPSLYRMKKNKTIYPILSKITWYILENEKCREAKKFFDEIGANSILIPYKGEEYDLDYDYTNDFMSIIIASAIEKIKLSNQISLT